jgi:hypothetical protein
MNTCGSSAIMIATSSLRLSPCGKVAARRLRLSDRSGRGKKAIGAIDPVRAARPARGDVAAASVLGLHGEADIFVHAELGKEVGQLEGPAKTQPARAGL